jgi:hypothetical protein
MGHHIFESKKEHHLFESETEHRLPMTEELRLHIIEIENQHRIFGIEMAHLGVPIDVDTAVFAVVVEARLTAIEAVEEVAMHLGPVLDKVVLVLTSALHPKPYCGKLLAGSILPSLIGTIFQRQQHGERRVVRRHLIHILS